MTNKTCNKTEEASVSVVIPTLGEVSLQKTISQLNKGSIVPAEILVCVPQDQELKADVSSFSNVKVIKTECRGQVRQRIEGFKKASCEYVMQLDDDIDIDEDCIAYLLEKFMEHDPKVAVAPSLINLLTGESVYMKPDQPPWVAYIYYWIMNGSHGYKPGGIDKTGSPVGFDTKKYGTVILESDWLPGGCVMHHKDNLVLENYFPFSGKAFGEDVMHSLKLKERDVKLYIQPKSKCYLEIVPMTAATCSDFLINLKSEIRIRKHYMKSISEESIRIDIYFILTVIRFLIKKLIINLKK